MKSETGKVYVNLSLEVNVHPLTGARNGPSRDRRRERRALAREAFERNAAQTKEGRKDPATNATVEVADEEGTTEKKGEAAEEATTNYKGEQEKLL